jgi:hypothetical protein
MGEVYSNKTRALIIHVLEKDITGLSYTFGICNYEPEDTAQELRLYIWNTTYNYNPHKGSIRTWGNLAIKRKAWKLKRDEETSLKRKANSFRCEFDDKRDNEYEND